MGGTGEVAREGVVRESRCRMVVWSLGQLVSIYVICSFVCVVRCVFFFFFFYNQSLGLIQKDKVRGHLTTRG